MNSSFHWPDRAPIWPKAGAVLREVETIRRKPVVPARGARCAAFTLIELLVVIGIIALLASLAMPVSNIVLRRAKEVSARTSVHGLLIAAKSYQTEYLRLPRVVPDAGTGTIEDSIVYTDPQNEMVATLLGKNTKFNPRQIKFLDPPQAKNECDGLVTYGTAYGLVDPWSDTASFNWQSYYLVLDYEGRGVLDNPLKRSANNIVFNQAYIDSQPDQLSASILVYSDGDWRVPSSKRKPITSW